MQLSPCTLNEKSQPSKNSSSIEGTLHRNGGGSRSGVFRQITNGRLASERLVPGMASLADLFESGSLVLVYGIANTRNHFVRS